MYGIFPIGDITLSKQQEMKQCVSNVKKKDQAQHGITPARPSHQTRA